MVGILLDLKGFLEELMEYLNPCCQYRLLLYHTDLTFVTVEKGNLCKVHLVNVLTPG